ncbi:RNA polymerase sigma-54 factor RpoN [Labilithrix luteola]|uniref:RNA polymerase sigma-54 factor RpoN n=1 Tax=Labilithrix luteola TaxID=1391654 RepID=A0A0K1PZD5_9BACT|nr:sigma-70 family RNA polymerase sigma factor [Labilithrix luteola]AKU98736.1 RNA polymerase sigma-54 factor RpoN [Labilithrix luteola]
MSEGLSNREVADLYRRYGFLLRRRCLMLMFSRAPAQVDDALQETFLKLIRAGAPIRTAEEPLRWLYRVADRTCFDLLRKTKYARRSDPIDDVLDELPANTGLEPELRRAAMELLDALGQEDQQIAVMAFIDGMNQQEIANELGYSRMTIIKRVARLKERAQRIRTRKPNANARRAGDLS